MKREAEWIRDALDAAARIREYTDSMDLETYLNDRLRQDAVERCFFIIAETLTRVRKHAPELAEQIPRMQRIVDFRNLLAHEYDKAKPEVIWKAVQHHLPPLQSTLEALLAEIGQAFEASAGDAAVDKRAEAVQRVRALLEAHGLSPDDFTEDELAAAGGAVTVDESAPGGAVPEAAVTGRGAAELRSGSGAERARRYFDETTQLYLSHVGTTLQAGMIGGLHPDPYRSTVLHALNACRPAPRARILDAGAGECGPSVHICEAMPGVTVTAVTVSPAQAEAGPKLL